jgi:hypothetical protein
VAAKEAGEQELMRSRLADMEIRGQRGESFCVADMGASGCKVRRSCVEKIEAGK